MSFEDYTFEDPCDSWDRGEEDDSSQYDYTKVYRDSQYTQRKCVTCSLKFKSQYPCACTRCGGWTNSL